MREMSDDGECFNAGDPERCDDTFSIIILMEFRCRPVVEGVFTVARAAWARLKRPAGVAGRWHMPSGAELTQNLFAFRIAE